MASSSNFEIQELNLIKFGKFENHKIDLKTGLNVIYGKNESGKSTVQLFIKAMLYGLPTRKKSGERLKERERAIPWKGTRAEGVMKISVGGRLLEIRRRFGKTAAGDKVEVCDSISGENLPEYSDGNIGEVILGIPCSVFEKTMWIRQGAIPIEGSDDELSSRLMNIRSSGDESVSAEAALARLAREKRQLKARDGRSVKGRIDTLIERREECRRRRYDLTTQLTQTEKTKERLRAAQAEQKQLENELSTLETEYKKSIEAERQAALRERLCRIDEYNKKLDLAENNEEYVRASAIDEKDTAAAFDMERRLNILKNEEFSSDDIRAEEDELLKKHSRASAQIGGGAVLAVLSAVMAVVFLSMSKIIPAVLGVILLGIAAAVIILGIRTSAECKTIKSRLDEEKDSRRAREKKKRDEEYELRSAYDALLSRFCVSDAAELQKLYNWRLGQDAVIQSLKELKLGILGDDTYEELSAMEESGENIPGRSAADIDAELSQKRRRHVELVSEIKTLEGKMAYEVKIEGLPSDIDTEISAIESEIRECERRLLVIETAEAAIKEASEVFRMSFAPALCEKVDEIITCLTGGKYNGVRVAEDYRMRVETDSELVDAEYFSCGTYEQLYFALRVASAELICKNVPMFLDDILTAYDNERALDALKFLTEAAKLRQIILFTCHLSDRENAESEGAYITNLN